MNQRGFTLPETVVSIALFSVISGIGMATLSPAIATAKTDSQLKRVVGFLHLARETAITRQRDIELVVDEENGVLRLLQIEDGAETPYLELALESRVRLHRFEDMGDTPDGFGGEGAVNFGDAARILFIGDGSMVGADDVPINGTLYLGIPEEPQTARAISVTGTTARPRAYRWISDAWVAQ